MYFLIVNEHKRAHMYSDAGVASIGMWCATFDFRHLHELRLM